MTISKKVTRDKRLTRGKFQNRIATGSFFCHAEEEKIPNYVLEKAWFSFKATSTLTSAPDTCTEGKRDIFTQTGGRGQFRVVSSRVGIAENSEGSP